MLLYMIFGLTAVLVAVLHAGLYVRSFLLRKAEWGFRPGIFHWKPILAESLLLLSQFFCAYVVIMVAAMSYNRQVTPTAAIIIGILLFWLGGIGLIGVQYRGIMFGNIQIGYLPLQRHSPGPAVLDVLNYPPPTSCPDPGSVPVELSAAERSGTLPAVFSSKLWVMLTGKGLDESSPVILRIRFSRDPSDFQIILLEGVEGASKQLVATLWECALSPENSEHTILTVLTLINSEFADFAVVPEGSYLMQQWELIHPPPSS